MKRTFVILILSVAAVHHTHVLTAEGGSCDICGESFHSQAKHLSRVINGKPIKPRWKYPWIVPMMIKGSPTFVCGAAVISDKYVLTAAHCLMKPSKTDRPECNQDIIPKKCWLKAKDIKIGQMKKSQSTPHRTLKVVRAIPHPEYHNDKTVNDIALLKVKTKFHCDKYTSPICLPTRKLSKMDDEVQIAGWGYYMKGVETSENVLREGIVKQVPSEQCQATTAQEKDPNKIFCTIGIGSKDQTSCQGDSGSSVFASFNDVFYSLGVTSMASAFSCPVDGPVTFTDTYAFMPFIQQYVKHLPSPPRK